MIRALIFDLGNVIVPFDFSRAYSRMEKLCGLQTSEIRARIGTTDLVIGLETGAIEPADFVAQLTRLLGVQMTLDEFGELWSSIFLPEPLISESLFSHLRERFRLILLSNTNAIHFGMIRENYPLLQHFHHKVLSYEVGKMKPSPEIYREAVHHAGCSAAECFFTDDIPEYVEGACREGIDAVLFQGEAKLRADLQQRGIAVLQ